MGDHNNKAQDARLLTSKKCMVPFSTRPIQWCVAEDLNRPGSSFARSLGWVRRYTDLKPRTRRFETISSRQKIRDVRPCCLISSSRRPSARSVSMCALRGALADTSAETRLIVSAVLRMVDALGSSQETRILAVIVVVTHLVIVS